MELNEDTRWHYISGAVYAAPGDADDPTKTAIVMRGCQPNPCIPDQFSPSEKDHHLRLCSLVPELIATLKYLYSQTIGADLLYEVGLSEGEQEAQDMTLALLERTEP